MRDKRNIAHGFIPLILLFLPLLLAACPNTPGVVPSTTFDAIAEELVAACPPSSPSDEVARDECAAALGSSQTIADHMADTILWGELDPTNTKNGSSIDPNTRSLTRFSSFVFRKLYLSSFEFDGRGETIEIDGFNVLKMPVRFRNQMTAGAYPYPFWHSHDKWNAYQRATELYFVFLGERMVAAYRVGADDTRATRDPGTFDGMWRWIDDIGEEQPYVSLFSWLLSEDNPHGAQLDMAFRRLESRARDEDCLSCHAPDNSSKMSQLVLLTFPNQALGNRHDLEQVFDINSMPPGMPLDEETRAELYELARAFAEIGDAALAFEHQR